MSCDSPLYIRSHSKAVLNKAIEQDTKFLADNSVMDYSLLVGLEPNSDELVLGIIGKLIMLHSLSGRFHFTLKKLINRIRSITKRFSYFLQHFNYFEKNKYGFRIHFQSLVCFYSKYCQPRRKIIIRSSLSIAINLMILISIENSQIISVPSRGTKNWRQL